METSADMGPLVVSLARGWLGTPYLHQASLKGRGADCLGLVRGVWRELYGAEPFSIPPYGRDWDEISSRERLWRALERWMAPGNGRAEGEVLLFRMAEDAPAKHLAIVAERDERPTIIHAYSGRSVLESPFVEGWRRRVVAAFQFPEKG